MARLKEAAEKLTIRIRLCLQANQSRRQALQRGMRVFSQLLKAVSYPNPQYSEDVQLDT